VVGDGEFDQVCLLESVHVQNGSVRGCILLFNTVLARVNDTQKHNITEWLKVCFDIARRILYFIV
jgi:hypothetical protein